MIKLFTLMLLLAFAGESSLHTLFHSLVPVPRLLTTCSGETFFDGASEQCDSDLITDICGSCPCCSLQLNALPPALFSVGNLQTAAGSSLLPITDTPCGELLSAFDSRAPPVSAS